MTHRATIAVVPCEMYENHFDVLIDGHSHSDRCFATESEANAKMHELAGEAERAQDPDGEKSVESQLMKRLGFSFKAQNSSLTVVIFEPKTLVKSLHQNDGKWDVVYKMDEAWNLLLELLEENNKLRLAVSTPPVASAPDELLDFVEFWLKNPRLLIRDAVGKFRDDRHAAALSPAQAAPKDTQEIISNVAGQILYYATVTGKDAGVNEQLAEVRNRLADFAAVLSPMKCCENGNLSSLHNCKKVAAQAVAGEPDVNWCERHIDTTLADMNVNDECPLCTLEKRTSAAEEDLSEAEADIDRAWEALGIADYDGEDSLEHHIAVVVNQRNTLREAAAPAAAPEPTWNEWKRLYERTREFLYEIRKEFFPENLHKSNAIDHCIVINAGLKKLAAAPFSPPSASADEPNDEAMIETAMKMVAVLVGKFPQIESAVLRPALKLEALQMMLAFGQEIRLRASASQAEGGQGAEQDASQTVESSMKEMQCRIRALKSHLDADRAAALRHQNFLVEICGIWKSRAEEAENELELIKTLAAPPVSSPEKGQR